MDFASHRPKRRTGENIVPMINVVFLLLIFFLMTAQIAPLDPFEISPPVSDSTQTAASPEILFVGADGTIAFQTFRGEAVFAALSRLEHSQPLLIRADAATKATTLARLLPQLAAVGITDVAVVTGPRP